MNNKFKKIISFILLVSLLISIVPDTRYFAAQNDAPEVYTLSNGYLTLKVSGKNGGFSVDTQEGNKLIKSDDNKSLLYHSDEYDTSFTSFQVTYPDSKVKEYIFGGNYSFLGLGSNNITTVQDATGITSEWTVDGLSFTQHISLANTGSNEHGMVLLSYKVKSARGDTVSVKQRLLLDSKLGSQDFAVYELIDENNVSQRIEQEKIIGAAQHIPMAFFGYDNPELPGVVAYTVNNPSSMPYQIAFAHWNNLAATTFDFAANSSMTFTNINNMKYRTADSAYALYYDMGDVAAGGEGKLISTNYGVYSNAKAEEKGEIAINIVSPLSLELSQDKKSYLRTRDKLPGAATFDIQMQLDNYISKNAKKYDKVTVAFYTSRGITALDNSGNALSYTPSYDDPFTIDINNFSIDESKNLSFYFKADVGDSTSYRKVEAKVFDTSNVTAGGGERLLKENLIASHSFYILCPGGDGSFPKISFTGSKPEIIYNKGYRNLYITGGNLDLLMEGDRSGFSLCAYNIADANVKYVISPENILYPEENVLQVAFTQEMIPGTYELKFELTEEFAQIIDCPRVLSAPALKVIVSADEKYDNYNYAIVAVVQEGKNDTSVYSIKSYKSEEEYNKEKVKYEEVLITLRGSFIQDMDYKGGMRYSSFIGNQADKIVTINNCIDFQNGYIIVGYKYSDDNKKESVLVDFNGDLYTSSERTSIWQGEAAFTEIKDGSEYGLIPYNKNGVKLNGFNQKPIMLIWPSALGLAQTLAGMIFKLSYGSLGVMYDTGAANQIDLKKDTPILGNTLSFSAMLDLGFLVPKSKQAKEDAEGVKEGSELYWSDSNKDLRGLWNHYYEESKKSSGKKGKEYTKGQAKVMVDDILFGCGQGFLGVNFAVEVGLPAYVDSMPSVEGTLRINTINNWSFGLKGRCKFTTLTMEVDLAIKSYNNIPIPDKLYFYIEGFEPGVNVDGFGVLWITGAGGGFDKLYDTIFLTDGVPPLKLMLSVAFDLMKVMTARADVSLSLRGIGLEVSNVKLKYIDIPIIQRMKLQLDWYPDIYFMASINLSFYAIIVGQGYIVVIDNDQYSGFFEAFVRGKLYIPNAIPIIGGIEIGRVDFGLNSNKIWGAASVIGDIGVSVVYYWGEDVNISLKKSSEAQPSFPELLGCEDIPVYYDEETGKTLYMRVGDNLVLAALADASENSAGMPRLLADEPRVESTGNRERHIVYAPNLGKKYVFSASFEAESLEKAREFIESSDFAIRDNLTKQNFPIEFYDLSKNNLNTANANLSFDEASKKAAIGITLTRTEDLGKEWEILTTGHSTEIIMFEVGSIPKINTVSGIMNTNNTISATWSGTELDKLDSISFYLTESNDADALETQSGELLAIIEDSAQIQSGTASFELPGGLPSGTYYLREVYSQEDIVNGVEFSINSMNYVNTNQPKDPSSVSIANAGDMTFLAELPATSDSDASGYLASVYEVTATGLETTDVTNMTFDRDEAGKLPAIILGGSYMGFEQVDKNTPSSSKQYGLSAGKSYKVGITAYNYVDKDGDGEDDYIVYGNEVFSDSLVLNDVSPPNIMIEPEVPFIKVISKEWQQGDNGLAVIKDVETQVSKSEDIMFNVVSDSPISGVWFVDSIQNEGFSGDFTDTESFKINLNKVPEGSHTLNISGKDSDGDSFRRTIAFSVDTQAPGLLLTSPVNGSCFEENGRLHIKGITDKDTRFSIEADGQLIVNSKTLEQLNGTVNSDGLFGFDIMLNPNMAVHRLVVSVEDAVGNSRSTELEVQNAGLSSIRRLGLYIDNQSFTNKNIALSPTGKVASMKLMAETDNQSFIINDSELVHWDILTVEGSAALSDDGVLTAAPNSIGMVTGGLKISDEASMTASATFGAEVFEKKPSPKPDNDDDLDKELSKKVKAVLSPISAKAGERVVIKLPQGVSGKNIAVLIMADGIEKVVAMSMIKDGSLIFIAPLDGEYYFNEMEAGFTDTQSHWAGDYIEAAFIRGIFNGMSEDLFMPEKKITRAMFITILGRLYGIDEELYRNSSFVDVTEDAWYSACVEWAFKNGIIMGVGNDRFAPDREITREEMCVLLERYLEFAGYEFSELSEELGFADEGEISAWSRTAVSFAQRTGLINGVGNGLFNPKASATRAQGAVILIRLINRLLEE